MPINNVSVDDPVLASTMNALINSVNGSPGRAIFFANSVWSVPEGVYRFRVMLCGGAGGSYQSIVSGGEGGQYSQTLYPGGTSPLCSKMFSGLEIGSSYNIIVGAGGNNYALGSGDGGDSSFGSLLLSHGGKHAIDGSPGDNGTHNGQLQHTNALFMSSSFQAYGVPVSTTSGHGANGIVVIEW